MKALFTNLRLLQVWDLMSLLLCMKPFDAFILNAVPTLNEPRDIQIVKNQSVFDFALSPWPFKYDQITFEAAGSVLPEKTYKSNSSRASRCRQQ